jgi:hypothetical protein
VGPQPRTWVIHATTATGDRVALTGPPGRDDPSSGIKASCSGIVAGHLRDVGHQGGAGEAVDEHAPRCGVALDGRDGGDAAAAERLFESADSGEQ